MQDFQLSPHFKRSEFMCHCGCEELVLDPRLVPALEVLRSMGPEPVIVHDAYRCAKHNAEVGGVPDSEHPKGMAADIEIAGLSLQQMYDRAKRVLDFAEGGIGVYDTKFVHVDVRRKEARWARVNNKYVGIDQLVTA